MKVAALLLVTACATDPFQDWKADFDKHYSPAEELTRRSCFSRSIQDIARLNAQRGPNITYALGPFADLCPDEFDERLGLGKPLGVCVKPGPPPVYDKKADLQQSIDWRTKGAVTPVKYQGRCGSCWAFSAVGAMEGAWFRKTGKLLGFSEQELVSCDKDNHDAGCNGGGADTAFQWVMKNGGIDTEEDYPYASGGGNSPACDNSKKAKKVGIFPDFQFVDSRSTTGGETKLLAALQNEGPISVSLNPREWTHYESGVMTASACQPKKGRTGHAVLIVGYGFEGNQAYWNVKNSWGTNFGENGYIRLAFNENACNVAVCFSRFPKTGSSPYLV